MLCRRLRLPLTGAALETGCEEGGRRGGQTSRSSSASVPGMVSGAGVQPTSRL